MADDLEHLRQWIGKTEQRTDAIGAWPVKALAATLGQDEPDGAAGSAVPPGWHWLFFLEAKSALELGDDGHPRKGGFLPPVPLPRRMWAGGRIEFLQPLSVGDAVVRDSEIISVEPKTGRTGTLVFVTVRHTVRTGAAVAIVEEQDIVYRAAAQPGDPLPPPKEAPGAPQWQRGLTPDSVLLFRYSALTFNGHRIHYDRDYALQQEHYPGLVVHGPLQTTLLLELCRKHHAAPVKKFEYRATAPVFGGRPLTVNGNLDTSGRADLWTASDAGHYAMRATAYF
jgi:3-methylfumaryl-CoA hydratase